MNDEDDFLAIARAVGVYEDTEQTYRIPRQFTLSSVVIILAACDVFVAGIYVGLLLQP